MQSFTDAADRQWTISMNPVTVDLVRSKHNVDLYEVDALGGHENPRDSVEWQLTANPILLCKVLFDLLVDRDGDVTFESFASQLFGDTLMSAREALWAEIVNFTPDPQERRVREAMQEKLKTLVSQGMDRIYQMIESPEMEAHLAGELKRLDDTFTSLLGECASTQKDSPPPSSP